MHGLVDMRVEKSQQFVCVRVLVRLCRHKLKTSSCQWLRRCVLSKLVLCGVSRSRSNSIVVSASIRVLVGIGCRISQLPD
eukprot:3289540-Amphidinium_carterae.1